MTRHPLARAYSSARETRASNIAGVVREKRSLGPFAQLRTLVVPANPATGPSVHAVCAANVRINRLLDSIDGDAATSSATARVRASPASDIQGILSTSAQPFVRSQIFKRARRNAMCLIEAERGCGLQKQPAGNRMLMKSKTRETLGEV